MRVFGFEVSFSRRKQATRFLGDLVKIDLAAGDVCVLMASDHLSADQITFVTAAWRAAVGDDVTLLVLDSGKRIGVLSPPQAAEVHERLSDEAAVDDAVKALGA